MIKQQENSLNHPSDLHLPDDLPEGIEDYLNKINYNLDISLEHQEELICKILCFIPISRETAEILLKSIFNSIINIILSGKELNLYNLGRIHLGKKIKIPFIKMKPPFKRKVKEYDRLEKGC